MKQLLLNSIACCAVLLPFSQAEAKTYGDFAVGKTFTLTVKSRITSKMVGTKLTRNCAVPAGIPDYKLGEKIKFTIGTNGKLTAKDGLSLPFKGVSGLTNIYYIAPSRTNPKGSIGHVYKSRLKKPIGADLSFGKFTISGITATTYSVYYTLK